MCNILCFKWWCKQVCLALPVNLLPELYIQALLHYNQTELQMSFSLPLWRTDKPQHDTAQNTSWLLVVTVEDNKDSAQNGQDTSMQFQNFFYQRHQAW